MFRELFSLDKLWNFPPFSFLPMSYTVKGFKIRQKGSFVNMAANKRENCCYLFQKKVWREKSLEAIFGFEHMSNSPPLDSHSRGAPFTSQTNWLQLERMPLMPQEKAYTNPAIWLIIRLLINQPGLAGWRWLGETALQTSGKGEKMLQILGGHFLPP